MLSLTFGRNSSAVGVFLGRLIGIRDGEEIPLSVSEREISDVVSEFDSLQIFRNLRIVESVGEIKKLTAR